MASSCLSNDERNFQCVAVASIDLIKLPLRDILASHIKPTDLLQKIKSCSTLNLRQEQLKICLAQPPDYNSFDVSLLYTLIRNLCSLPSPAQGWGKAPKATDTQISDDIERLRLFRNIYYAHAESAGISESLFKDIWRNLRLAINRIQSRCNVNYEDELIRIEQSKYTLSHWQECMTLLNAYASKHNQADCRDEPDIFIQGENEIFCGGTARFEADVKNVESSCWSITWQKHRGDVIKRIDTNMGRFSGSTKKTLVISDVCKEDEGEYQAVLSLESNGPDYKSKNTIRLHAIGDIPYVDILGVTSGSEGIAIHYKFGVLEHSPIVHQIEWSKNGQQLDNNSKKYVGGSVHDSCFTITSPTNDDKGNYSCKVTNPVGSVSENISLDIPSVEIFVDSHVCFGSETTIRSEISSTPPPEKIEWQKSMDGDDFSCIRYEKYPQSTDNSTCPSIVIKKTSFDDRLLYRLMVWNAIGESVSNTMYLNVTGSPPNITTSYETNIKNRSVKLIGNVYFFDDSPGILETFWTKDDEKINTEESGGKLSEISNNDNPSLAITNVGPDDAGEYKLTAINAVGSSTSDAIILGAPSVFLERIENEKNGDRRITVTIKSLPAPCHIQWSAKRKGNDTFTMIDINAEQFKGTTVFLPHPVLVVRQKDQLENTWFRIDVTNFIGKTMHDISSNVNPLEHGNTVKNRLYDDEGASVRFTKLNNILVNQFPPSKVEHLKFLLITSNKVRNRKSVLEATSALDCLRILQDENLFTQSDVIFMQFLCRENKCFDLYKECIEYAEKQKALCYFEKMPVNGYTDVECHVKGDLSRYTKEYIRKVKETVAAILDCREEDILLNGVRRSTSFVLSLSVKNVYIRKLLAMNGEDRLKLRCLDIDYLIVDEETIRLDKPEDSVFTKDPAYSLRDVLRCHLCGTPGAFIHCENCDKYLCEDCEEWHLSDVSTDHKLVLSKLRTRTNCITNCLEHSLRYCDLYCEQCNVPICLICASLEHRGHKSVDIDTKGIKQLILQKDLQELENSIFPKYQEIASITVIQKAEVYENSHKLTTAINKHEEDLHRKINTAFTKLKSDLIEMESKTLICLNKLEDKIKFTISEISQSIVKLKKILSSNDASLISTYKSRNAEFRGLPQNVSFSLPIFKPPRINQEQIDQLLGSLSVSSIKIRNPGHTMNSESSPSYRPLIDVPRIITYVRTVYRLANRLCSVSCLSDDQIWVCGYKEKIMRLYNLQGELVRSIQTTSGNKPEDIAVTRNGDLVYSDYFDRTVNLVKNTQIQTVIRLQGWRPLGVCSTSSGDLLVVMDSVDNNQTKIGRYSGSKETQTIQYNDKGIPLYSSSDNIKYISENRNLDICVSDLGAGAVVVVNQAGKLQFTYTGPPSTTKGSFNPAGITTDSQGRILSADCTYNNHCIHILDQYGQFLRYIVNCHLQYPRGLCVDTRDNLFVTESITGAVKKIQYCI